MAIKLRPHTSFIGTLHVQASNGWVVPHGLSATYIDNAPTSLDSGWVYADSGDSYSGWKPIAFGIDQAAGRLVGLPFWFGSYFNDDDHTYSFDLQVYDARKHVNPFQGYCLNVSRNGYVGVYSKGDERGPLWGVGDIDPSYLAEGHERKDLTLTSPEGRKVRRLMEERFPYLNDISGDDCKFTLRVEKVGVPRP
jgi:hypothetical protein